VLGLDARGVPDRILDAGVRIFSDGREPKSGNSLAEGRRVARGMARRRDRYKRRRKAVLRTLTEYGLMPADPKARQALLQETNDKTSRETAERALSDVYNLRARALSEKLPLHHIGRALFHLNQRRGFKSNRKADRKTNEKGAIALGTEKLHLAIREAGAETLGQYLAKRRGIDPALRGNVRVRVGQDGAADNADASQKPGYNFYPDRALLEEEFKRIWAAQSAFQPDIFTPERGEHLFRVMFYQRPLKPAIVGKCSFNPAETRLAKAHPLFQAFRLYKEVNELGLVMPDESQVKLTRDQRDKLVLQLSTRKTATYEAMRRLLKLTPDIRFNKESETRDKMIGDEVKTTLGNKKAFGNRWSALSMDEQWSVIERLREEQDEAALHDWLMSAHRLSDEAARVVAEARLPEGYGRLGRTAMEAMLEELQNDVIPEAEAAKRAGYDHALARTGDGVEMLPPYQEILERRIPPGTGDPDDTYDVRRGRITNPTVHIALNQLRGVANGLIRRYGRPERIHIELARELNQSDDQKRAANLRNAQNRRDAERRSKILLDNKQPDNGFNRQLVKQWEELNPYNPLDRRCVYSGAVISAAMLFSGTVDIDHILPWSRTLDDSPNNRILCTREANRQKGTYAPAQVPQWMGRYDDILARAAHLPEGKRWRFAQDAMQRFEKDRDFLDRQLTDTQYLARLAHDYVGALYPDEEADGDGVVKRRNHVVVVTGKMTEMLRRKWGLNSLLPDHNYAGTAAGTAQAKNRKDHRHHAIDAAVIGVISRSLLKRIADAAGEGETQGAEDAIRFLSPPWETFRDDLKAMVERIVVSHKPDHGTLPKPGENGRTAGQLHNDTAYGITGERDARGNTIVVRRKSFLSLTDKDIANIRDDELRSRLHSATGRLSGREFAAALDYFRKTDPKFHRIRRVRLTEALTVIPIRDRQGRVYKGYKGDANFRYDVWELPDGKWIADVVTMFDAHRPDRDPQAARPHPAARKVLSLKQNDLVAYEHPKDGRTIGRVVKFSMAGQIVFAAHNEAGALKARDADGDDPFKYFSKAASGLREIGARQVRVDATGRVFDPGPQHRQARLERRAQPSR
jgi:CRISPR-associated endonuclease Csn1